VINEDPIELFYLPASSADIICTGIKDVLVSCKLPSQCRGQAYDGAANMYGHRRGVATLINREYPSAVAVHCYVRWP